MSTPLSKRVESLEATRRPTKQPTQLTRGPIDALIAKLRATLEANERESARREKLPIDEQIALLDRDRAEKIAKHAEPQTSDAIPTAIDEFLERSYALRRADLVARRDGVVAGDA